MRVTISHITAAYHWLMTTMDGRALAGLERRATLGSCPSTVRDLARFELEQYQIEDRPIELLTNDAGCRPAPDRFDHHVSSRDYPQGAFISLEGSIQVVSPELSFWQMSDVLPLGELIKYGNALNGMRSYTLDNRGRQARREEPLTSAQKLAEFARRMGISRRRDKLCTALKYLVDGSDSPMENCVSILMCLKRQYGGLVFPKPIMGYEVTLDEVGVKLTGKRTCRCDMYWPGANYDLEYDSDQEHTRFNSATEDSLRRTAIKLTGIEVDELRTPQVRDPDAFLATAKMVAKQIGHGIRKRSPGQEYKYYQAYLDLRKELFWWERLHAGLDPSPLRIGELDW